MAAAARAGCIGIRPATSSPRTAGAFPHSGRSNVRQAGWRTAGVMRRSVGYADNALTGNGLQESAAGPGLRQRLYLARPDGQSRDVPEPYDAPRLESYAVVQRQRVLPGHSHQHTQRRHQRRFPRSIGLPAERGRTTGAGGGRLHRIPDEWSDRREYALSFVALHRQCAAERRAGREMQRSSQPQPHRSAQLRSVGPGHRARLAQRGKHHHRGGGLRRQPIEFRPVHALGYLNPDGVSSANAYADGVTGGSVDGVP